MARDCKHIAWQIHMLWVLCCGDMLHWVHDGNKVACCVGECTEHLEVRHAFGSCSKHGDVCENICVMGHNMTGCMHPYNGMMQCQLVEHTITKLPFCTMCIAL